MEHSQPMSEPVPMIRDAKYRAKLPFRARGHAELVDRIGGVFAEIDARLETRDRVRVLELGCGYGTVLLELDHRYGLRVEVHGINREHRDGNVDIFRRNGLERGLIAPEEATTHLLPSIAYVDVADGLPYADNTFDVVYSQVAWRYFGNKIHVLREVSRVLREGGIAKIDAEEIRPDLPPEYQRLVEIWNERRLVTFHDYAAQFGMGFVASAEGEYLRFGKTPRFGEDIERVFELDLGALDRGWNGVKCVYRTIR
jgi:SAM-dependent methyltransferase